MIAIILASMTSVTVFAEALVTNTINGVEHVIEGHRTYGEFENQEFITKEDHEIYNTEAVQMEKNIQVSAHEKLAELENAQRLLHNRLLEENCRHSIKEEYTCTSGHGAKVTGTQGDLQQEARLMYRALKAQKTVVRNANLDVRRALFAEKIADETVDVDYKLRSINREIEYISSQGLGDFSIRARLQEQENLFDDFVYSIEASRLEDNIAASQELWGISEEQAIAEFDKKLAKLDDKKIRTDWINMQKSAKYASDWERILETAPNVERPQPIIPEYTGCWQCNMARDGKERGRINNRRAHFGLKPLPPFQETADEWSQWTNWIIWEQGGDFAQRTEYGSWVIVSAPSSEEFTSRTRKVYLVSDISNQFETEYRTRTLIVNGIRDDELPAGEQLDWRTTNEADYTTERTETQAEFEYNILNPAYIVPTVENLGGDADSISFSDSVAVAHELGIKGAGVSVVVFDDSFGTEEHDLRMDVVEAIAIESSVADIASHFDVLATTNILSYDVVGVFTGSKDITTQTSTSDAVFVVDRDMTQNATALIDAGATTIVAGAIDSGNNILGTAAGDFKNDFLTVEASDTDEATANLTGATALIRSNNTTLNAEAIKTLILTTATDIGAAGIDDVFGNGELNLLKALSIGQ